MNEKKPIIFNSNNQIITAIILIVFFVIFYLNFGFISSIYNSIIIFIQEPFNSGLKNIDKIKTSFIQYEEVLEENNTLKEENVALLQENTNLIGIEKENKQLKELLDYTQSNNNYKYITAQVYARDSINLTNTITIDKGTSENIQIEDHVVFNGVYLGKIVSTSNNNAHVRLITSPSLSIVGQIPSINTEGIVKGQLGFGLVMKDIPPDAKLEIGQVVTTAAIGSTMPSNLLLGEIIDIKRNDQDIFQEATLKPYFDLEQIQYVLVKVSE